MNQSPYSVSEHQTSDIQSLGPKFDQQLRVMQIIAVALMMGVLSFFGVVLVITEGDVFGQQGPALITTIAAVFAGMMIVAHAVIPSIIANAQLRISNKNVEAGETLEARTSSIVNVYQVQLIIALALLEGAAFFNLIGLMIGKHFLSTLLVVALLLLMLLKFPTRTKVTWWVEDRMRELP